jgi:type II secretory pathway pseudopilin PulG
LSISVPSRIQCQAGVSLVEILLVLALSALVATLSIAMVVQQPSKVWNRVAEDYVQHLAKVYNKVVLQHGDTPINALTSAGATRYSDGITTVLQSWESIATYTSSSPAYFTYPSKIRVYVNPEDTAITDTGNELPIHQTGTPSAIMEKSSTVVTNNKEWLLLDMNGTDAPNSMGVSGDRVLLIVDDATGRVMTAWQKCNEFGGTVNGATNTTCTLSTVSPNRVYYRSFYDVYKGY